MVVVGLRTLVNLNSYTSPMGGEGGNGGAGVGAGGAGDDGGDGGDTGGSSPPAQYRHAVPRYATDAMLTVQSAGSTT